jgi:hypothetical protein
MIMEANKTVTPTLPKMYVDPHQPGLIRWNGCDPFAGILAGVKAPAIVRACNAHDDLVEHLEEWHERLDNLWHATTIPMPPQIHAQALAEAVQRLRDEMAAVITAAGAMK